MGDAAVAVSLGPRVHHPIGEARQLDRMFCITEHGDSYSINSDWLQERGGTAPSTSYYLGYRGTCRPLS